MATGYENWVASHQLFKKAALQECGKAKLKMEAEDAGGFSFGDVSESWKNQQYEYHSKPPSSLRVSVAVGDAVWPHMEFFENDYHWQLLEISWSPTCQHVAYWLQSARVDADSSVGIFNPDRALLIKPAGPTIHIMAHKTASATVDPIFDALISAGFAPHVGANAMKDRSKSVVYTRDSIRDVADRIASTIPGGATVDKITWLTPADIIVATGTSVLGE